MFNSTLKRKNWIFVLTLSLVLSISVTAGAWWIFGNDEEENKQENAQAQKEVRVIEHAIGKTKITGTPKRIVTLYQGANDAAVALGVTPVGVVDSWVQKPMYKYLRDELKGVQHVGLETQPNLEEIAKLNPDLIIASKVRHEKIYSKLSQIAPTVAHETVFKFKETVKLVGQAMNKEEKANKIISNWEQRVTDFKEKVKNKLGDKWPLEVSVLNFRADHARIYFSGYAGRILDELGFKRPKSHQQDKWGIKLTSKESIPAMNADVFFVFMSDNEAVQNTYQEWTNHPLWKNLDAVKKDQVYRVDQVAWNMAGGIISAHNMLDQIYNHFNLKK
ncbi:ABC-type Fe3+-hydroxamate transport system, periplasmic component [Halobacteroides halobius DSM 5150]|uniref:ABC-type Fe3+-hydroxamate transport system, periplasmic component n=1 Tax=Halobacteroides halobius (strain ATCC 35273 / DSM 5150 / MD-1) TaxID=748449 RepID=L0KA70_HALHC|nr:iron-siderophore ABC transporter substrate-binding protein [Halobacteroides halobius]AGB42202.1 ABC-type Fe3+-hydroxamate transport system, periplasmic component [Halobacteroides halobius DSM 5150]